MRQYSSANRIVSTRVTTGSPFGSLTSGSSYKSILKNVVWFYWHFKRLDDTRGRFPSPWTVDESDACFIVRDKIGQALGYFGSVSV